MSSSKKAVPCLQVLGERLFFDISSPSTPTFGGNHHWLLVINDCSNYCWSFFLCEKSDLIQTTSVLINNLKTKFNFQVQHLHCNNAGENQAFEKTCKQNGLGINFKYTAPGMQVCYPFQPGTCHAQWWQVYCLSAKWSLGRSCEYCLNPQKQPD